MKQKKNPLLENDRLFRSVAQKIGIAMIMQVAIFYVLNFAVIFVAELLMLVLNEDASYVISEILYMIAYLSAFLIPAIVLHKILGKRAVSPFKTGRGLPKLTPLLTLCAIAINFAAAYFNQLLVSCLIPIPDGASMFVSEPMTVWYQYVLLFLSTAVVPAVCEEILFRGVILTNLIPFGRGTAILASGILFGLMHGNIMQFFYTALLGVVLGYIYVRTRSLWLCMLIHFVNNGIGVLQESLNNLPDEALAFQINCALEILVMVLGAVSLILLLIKEKKKPKVEDRGSFGVILEPVLEYEEYTVTAKRKWTLFFTPTMIIFFVISGGMMASTVVSLLLLWVIV